MKKTVSLILCILLLISGTFFTVSAADDSITVNFSVYENVNGNYLFWKTDFFVKKGSTALSVLDECGLEYKSQNGYVSKIGGFAEFAHGAKSGWVYKINGAQPNVSAAKYVLKNGDKINWIYVTDYAAENTTAPLTTGANVQNSTAQNNTAGSNTAQQNGSSASNTSAASSSTASSSAVASTAAGQAGLVTENTEAGSTAQSSKSNIISSSLNFLKQSSGSFTPLVLSLYKQAINSSIKDELVAEATKNDTIEPIDCERLIINLSAVGYDVSNVGGTDLAKLLLNSNSIMKSGLNGAIFGLFAISHCNVDEKTSYTNSAANLVQKILQNQNEDGGFSLTYGDASDVDITAMALSALGKYKTQAAVSSAIDKGLLWLLNNQNPDGSFSNGYNDASCESTAQVIIALESLGVKTTDERFIKDRNVYDAFLDFYTGTGFSHKAGGSSNVIATEQALLAFYAYNNAKNPYTETISSHLDEINLWLFLALAAAVVIICAAALIVLKKKGYIMAAEKEKAKADLQEQQIVDEINAQKSAAKKKKKDKNK